ncbi:hypothetical protein TVAG_390890 [Trichomonas vaginalis G3]|uniref:Uncharacterized protein n=1 Tax=Trichomonas vaginalis (strain ATCC PRA-98 / G3) TaxID=412133 RepID=A2FE03_TRIV3|nr:hypothetical protein TVAGG3_0402480 [Trichomonas vaginalis G3]EAX96882.1 hypothetical protein TVAG_390890 [Trichomonas vaginalis G3]KAI5534799.1 hypothetical protein TVAGG3_0402480 [Trichomonas vaginalis G3]|eukprot:XP_001309812.1 hypothetical protein [Trichomonas vaginalis G3]
MNIEDLEKTTYYHNIDKIIKIKGSYKGDDVDSFHCSIDDKEEEITHRSNYDDISQSYNFTADCKISSSINQEKGYTLKVWAVHSNEVSDVVIKQFSLKRNNPVLKVSDLSKGSYFHKRDSSISVSGYVSDIDGDEYVTIESYIEGYQTTTRSSKSISIQSSSEYPFSLNVNIPDSLPRGNYRLIIRCCDSLSKCASTIKRFYFDYNKPVLRVSDLSKDTYIHKRDSIITVSGSVSDIDGDESVTIESYIEGYQTTTRSSKSISIQSSSEYPFNLNVNIPDSLPRGNYRLIIRCCDSLPKCASTIKRFYFEYNNPVLQIIKKPIFPVFINRDKFINFTLSVSDIDGNSHIRIYHSLNNTEGNLVNISLQEETSKEFDYNIPLPSDINAGDCLLKFYAVDEHNLYSDYKTLNVSIIKSFHTYKFELSYAIKRRR